MISQQQLLDLGMAPDLESLERQLTAAAETLGFGRVLAVLIRGSLYSGRAWVKSVGNTPAAYIEAQRSLDDTLRDPVMSALQRSVAPVVYDQAFYNAAGASDLWDVQAPYDYKCGVACSVHQPSHAESFLLGFDRSAPVPSDPVARMMLIADMQLLTAYAQTAMQRLLTPAPSGAPVLERSELECLRWARDGYTAWQVADRLVISSAQVQHHQQQAVRKLGANSVPGAVLRCIQGGLID